MTELIVSILQRHPGILGIIGTTTGWLSVHLLHAAQITAAILAAMVSLCTLVIIAPKALETVRGWFRKTEN